MCYRNERQHLLLTLKVWNSAASSIGCPLHPLVPRFFARNPSCFISLIHNSRHKINFNEKIFYRTHTARDSHFFLSNPFSSSRNFIATISFPWKMTAINLRYGIRAAFQQLPCWQWNGGSKAKGSVWIPLSPASVLFYTRREPRNTVFVSLSILNKGHQNRHQWQHTRHSPDRQSGTLIWNDTKQTH